MKQPRLQVEQTISMVSVFLGSARRGYFWLGLQFTALNWSQNCIIDIQPPPASPPALSLGNPILPSSTVLQAPVADSWALQFLIATFCLTLLLALGSWGSSSPSHLTQDPVPSHLLVVAGAPAMGCLTHLFPSTPVLTSLSLQGPTHYQLRAGSPLHPYFSTVCLSSCKVLLSYPYPAMLCPVVQPHP